MKPSRRASCLVVALLVLTGYTTVLVPARAASDPDVEGWPLADWQPPYGTDVPMPDGAGLATLVYTDAVYSGRTGPTILLRTPYDIATDSYELFGWTKSGENPGAFIVHQDLRGRFHSDGQDTLFGDDWHDGYDTCRWIRGDLPGVTEFRWWYDGHIGSWGASADAINQYCYAGHPNGDLTQLQAQYMICGTPEQYDNLFFQGGAFRYNLIKKWATGQESWPYARDTIRQHPKKDSWWAPRSLQIGNRFQHVHASAIHYGGWYDCFAQGTRQGFVGYNYDGATTARDHQILIMAGMGHGLEVGDIDWPGGDTLPAGCPDYQWLFDVELHEVNGSRGSPEYEAEWAATPKVWYYLFSDPAVHGTDPRACSWQTADDWPVPSVSQRWFLHKGANQWSGTLQLTPPAGSDSITYTHDPSVPCPTNGGNNLYDSYVDNEGFKIGQGCTDQRGVPGGTRAHALENVVARGDVISFTSDAFVEPYEFTGDVRAHLYVQSDCPDTDFVGKLVDVFPDGREMLVTEGNLRACRMNGYDTTTWMSPGTVYELDVELWANAWRFQPGHKLKLLVMSANFPKHPANPNQAVEVVPLTLGSYNVAHNTIMLSSTYSSYVELPTTNATALGDPALWITSTVPEPSPSTSYTVKWDATGVDSVDVKRNGETVATGQPASNPDTGYEVTGLTPNTANTITVVGHASGHEDVTDAIGVHPYCDAPEVTLTHPLAGARVNDDDVDVTWSIDATNAAGISRLWIETDALARTELTPGTTHYLLSDLPDGTDHWVNVSCEGNNGLLGSRTHSFETWGSPPVVTITSGTPPPSNQTTYAVTWTGTNVDNISIFLNGNPMATGQPASNPGPGYAISGLTPNVNNDVCLHGKRAGYPDDVAHVTVHPYCNAPGITIGAPQQDQVLVNVPVVVNFTISATSAGGLSALWIGTNIAAPTQVTTTTTSYAVPSFVNGSNWVEITAVGANGMVTSLNRSYFRYNATGSPPPGNETDPGTTAGTTGPTNPNGTASANGTTGAGNTNDTTTPSTPGSPALGIALLAGIGAFGTIGIVVGFIIHRRRTPRLWK